MRWFHGLIAENIATHHTLSPGLFLRPAPTESKLEVTFIISPYCFALFAASRCYGDFTGAANVATSTYTPFTVCGHFTFNTAA